MAFVVSICLVLFVSLILLRLQRRRHLIGCLNLQFDMHESAMRSQGVARKSARSSPVFTSTLRHLLIGCLCGFMMGILGGSLVLCMLAVVFGIAGAYLFFQWRRRIAERQELEELNRMVPVVMERLVMAAQAGLDVIASIQALLDIARCVGSEAGEDGVTLLLKQVMQRTERGAGFTSALQSVAEDIPSVAVRHAFIHLAVAHDEGGEIVRPLRELSDSAQLFYQENLEEYISRLPVQATLPLLCTFAGLILFFLTTPLIQVVELLATVELPG